MAEKKRQSLGRGLNALLGDEPDQAAAVGGGRGPRQVAVELLHPGRYQPRHSMSEEAIEELAQSVRENGIIQPLLVRRHPDKDGAFEIIAGERRWRAAQLAKLHQVPVVVRDLSDQETLEVALVENLQRQDLSPMDEAIGYKRLVDEFGHTQEVLAKTVGKSRSHVANMMRLLGLPEGVKKMLDSGALTTGHARALLNAPEPLAAAREVAKKGLNVRQAERLVRKLQRQKKVPPKAGRGKDVDTLALEREMTDKLGIAVTIQPRGEGGTVSLRYASLEQLDDVLERLGRGGAVGTGDSAPGPRTIATKASRKKKGRPKPKISVGLRSAKDRRTA